MNSRLKERLPRLLTIMITSYMSLKCLAGFPVCAETVPEAKSEQVEEKYSEETSDSVKSGIVSPSIWEVDEDDPEILIIHIVDTDVSEADFPDTGYLEFRHIIRKVIISEGITDIPDEAFKNCDALEEIEIPETVKSIGNRAFSGCASLVSIHLPDSVEKIGYNGFSDCTNLKNIKLPGSLTAIPDFLFARCSGLETFSIPDTITEIGNNVFQDCDSLTEITFPESIRSFGKCVLKGCDLLHTVNYNSGYAEGSDSDSLIKNCPNLTTINYGSTVTKVPGHFLRSCGITEIKLPATITEIGDYAFYNCNNLSEIDIPEGITAIGSQAIEECTNITEITIPESVVEIGVRAINSCSSLTTLNFNAYKLNRNTEEYIVNECENLTEIHYGDKVTEIPAYFLRLCGITEVLIPERITGIGASAFCQCNEIKSATIPENMKSLGKYIFHNCDGLEELYYNATEAERNSGDYLIDECDNLTTIHYGQAVTRIPDYFLRFCGVKEVNIPETITGIGEYSFFSCNSLEEVVIPQNVTSIGSHAFHKCDGITELTVPEGVTDLGGAFICQCSNLTTLYYNARNAVNSTGNAAIKSCPNLQQVIFGSNVEKIPEHFMEDCGIREIGEDALTNIQEIGAYAFMNCNDFTDIWIPEKVKVGNYAFKDCSNLTVHGYDYYGQKSNDAKTMAGKCKCKFQSIADHTWGQPVKKGSLLIYRCKVCGVSKYDVAKDGTSAPGAWTGSATYSYSTNKGKFILCQSGGSPIKLKLGSSLVLGFNKNGASVQSISSGSKKIFTVSTISEGSDTIKIKIKGKKTGNAKLIIRYKNQTPQYIAVKVRKNQKIKCGSTQITKKKTDKSFKIKASCPSKKMKLTSSNKSVVRVNNKGKVTIKGTGKATITIRAKENKTYFESIKHVKVIIR